MALYSSKLKPYENWEAFYTEGRKYWQQYADLVKPVRVLRIALRYINRIEVSLPFNDFSEYILTNPQIAPKLPQAVFKFLMRLEIPYPEIEAMAIITQTMDKPKAEKLPLILDIDVFKQVGYSCEDETIWEDFQQLRIFKNEIFFNSITDKTKELFK